MRHPSSLQAILPPMARLATLDITAASGAVLHDDVLFVIADDGHSLHRYTTQGGPLAPIALFAGRQPLPASPRDRKKAKPDLEALALLPDGALLALGSGSAPARRQGCHVAPASGAVRAIDLAPLYEALAREFPALNIEGAVVWRGSLLLAQRGNHRGGGNALVLLDLDTVMAALEQGALTAQAMRRLVRIALGELDGVALALTDLATGPDDTLWFVAAAENTDNPIDDGVCTGSVIGRLDDTLQVAWQARLAPDLKVEGLHFHHADATGAHWLLVADADSETAPAPLLALTIPAAARAAC